MDTPDGEMAVDSTESPASNQCSDTTSEAQISTRMDAPLDLNQEDSASDDVSMSAETDDEEDEALFTSAIQVNSGIHNLEQSANMAISEPAGDASNKRKFSSPPEDIPNGHKGNQEEPRKRLKPGTIVEAYRTTEGRLQLNKSLLPAEIWHRIFTYVPPRALGLLLQVNKSFNAHLDPSSSDNSITPLSRSVAQVLKPDAIWQASRRLFRPHMPVPLSGKSELEMWKLACSPSCQFCGKKKDFGPGRSLDQWHPGPGENGIIPIWSFGVRSCGSCLQSRTSKDIDLLLSSFPNSLTVALPFVFLTNELHVLPLATLQSGQPPPSIQITKNYFRQDLEEIQREFSEVQTMGSATAEEWVKGLEDRGRERKNDAARWERWDLSGGVARMYTLEPQETNRPITSSRTSSTSTPNPQGPVMTNGHIPISHGPYSTQAPTQRLPQNPNLPQPIHTNFSINPPPRFDSPSQNGFASYPPRAYPSTKHERTKEEVAELKATRRAEIEKRCLSLDPPLTAGVLAHMPSFQAAIQIIQPLTDSAWEVLQPRLISQRADAEQRENERLAQTRVVQERNDERNIQDMQPRSESKDLDQQWEDIQAPLRTRIGGYADETIRDAWAGGDKVNKDNCPAFAAEVLMYVRKRFYAEVAKDEAAVRATGREPEMDPPNGPYTRKLTLENMKWVFDNKIKLYTEQYRKELFLCSECDHHLKWYGFEGVIQHYAAKHTNDLSNGSIVVHWKSEWPEYPPFSPEPLSVKPSYYAAPSNAGVPYPVPTPQQNYGYGGYQPVPVSAPMQLSNLHGYQESPGPYYGNPQFGDQYAGHQNGPYAPPPIYPEDSQSYQAPQYSAPPPMGGNLGYSEPTQDYSQQGYGGQYQAPSQAYYPPSHPGPLYPGSVSEAAIQQPSYAPQEGQYGYSYTQPPVQAVPPPVNDFPPVPYKTEEYKTQLQAIAKSAREVWDAVNNIKDIPNSVKVYTIIYHVLKRSRDSFPEDPPLSMINDGLSNNKDMRKVRNINGLLCKACSLDMAGSSSAPQKKHYSFPQLVNHFYTVHEQAVAQNEPGHIPDWTKDMVDLPDLSRFASALKKPGINEQKLKLIGEALPEIFAAPQPNRNGNYASQTQAYGDNPDRDAHTLAPSQDNHDKYYSTVESNRPSENGSVIYDSGQYDPRNPRDPRDVPLPVDSQPRYRVLRRAEDYYPETYQDQPEHSYLEPKARSPVSHVRPVDAYGRVIVREEAPRYAEQQIRYHDEGEIEYRVHREPATISYDDPNPALGGTDYRLVNSQSYRSNRQDIPTQTILETPSRDLRYLPAEDAVTQQNRIFEVVAQISQQVKQAREKKLTKDEPADGGSEDGELQTKPSLKSGELGRVPLSTEASNAAERFLDEFQPSEPLEGSAKRVGELDRFDQGDRRPRWEDERVEGIQRIPQSLIESQRRSRGVYEDDSRPLPARGRTIVDDDPYNTYIIRDRAPQPRHASTYTFEDRYPSSAPEHAIARERSPELVDRRFKLNNVVYRDERQGSHGMHRTPSRYARYESVRLENDRARSRSPVYVKMGPQPGQYRERSPVAQPLHQEPVYRTRTPLALGENITYERAPRQEYYRVFADEPRQRQPQYVEEYEYVQVSDPQGDYMVRRPVRRERAPEPIYATYEDEQYPRKPVYETRAPVSRSDPAYYEEYDPRHPAPPPTAAPVRQRYE